ncbi:hypothetical protein [Metabacillus fastidiosus]|uniref:hypothetical protein n=1 Tax=Metabacillus fastidiosus TaxID=1458 RepID=UPI002DB7AE73|nr:hypothetical protein [Metabacillus fastidiosus]MEC2078489.1 hypothetical protein [Metabacillus fastidiosus]
MEKLTGLFGYLFCVIALFFFVSGFLEAVFLINLIPVLSINTESLIASLSLVAGLAFLQIKKIKSQST